MKKTVYYLVIVALSLLGLWALWVRVEQGMKVTALTSYISWGLWVSVYIYFIGLSAGSFLLSTMIYVFRMHQLERVGRMALLTALFSLGAGLLFIWVDLGHLERFWEIFTRPHFTSMMAIESYLYLVYMALILAELWLLMRDDLATLRDKTVGWRRPLYRLLALGYRTATAPAARQKQVEQARWWITALGILGIPTAVGVHGGTGAIFAVAIARPYWNGGLFPIVFLVSALASGAALVTFLYAAFGPRVAEFLQVLKGVANLTILFIGIDLLLLLSEAVTGLYGGVPSHVEVFNAIFQGPFAFVFWLGQLGLAAVVPIVAVSIALTRQPRLPHPQAILAGHPAPPRGNAPTARRRPVGALTLASLAIVAVVVAGDALVLSSQRAPVLLAASSPELPVLSTIGFWVAQLALVAGVVALLAQRWGSPHFWLGLAGLSTVAGILAVRVNIVIPGFVVPVLEHLNHAYQDPRLRYTYFPNGLEWASTVGLVALIVFLFSLAYELLPIYGLEEKAR
ncbi:MAG: polysulfide reductase NrfD [Chloroflexi bacterium]|nr:polysulfide reductase NrfD [Chloroflexota bacterium]